LPQRIKRISHDDDILYVYLQFKVGKKWKNLDATWDIGLKGILDINYWNGKSATKIAATPLKTYSAPESMEIFHEKMD